MGIPDQAVSFLAGCCSFLLGLIGIHHKLPSLLKSCLSALCPLCSPFLNSTGTLQASSYLSVSSAEGRALVNTVQRCQR